MKNELTKRKNFKVTNREKNLLTSLLSNIEDIQVSDKGTMIKFKGHLVTVSDGSIITQSSNGHIVQIANTIQLNPELSDVSSVDIIDKQIEKDTQIAILEMKNENKKVKKCKDCNKK